jgi:glycosyltransferase involved in cell wall biosynthesis
VYSAGLPALVLGRLSGAPVVISEHYTGFQRGLITGYDRLTARLAFRYAELVAPVSEDLAKHVRAVQPRARLRVVGNVVDTEVFHPPPPNRPPDGPPRLLIVAALAAKKGHSDLLEALAELQGEGRQFTLDVVGDGPLRTELAERSRRLGLADSVTFHGERPKAEVAELMRRADLFVLPSLFENLPCVLIESLASGLPFVATEVGGVPELADGSGTFMSPPADPPLLAKTIASALERRGQADPQALARRAQRRFGYESFQRTWSQIYSELLSRR